MEHYLEKFINAEIDGKALSKLDNEGLSNVVYMNNVLERKIMMKCLEVLISHQYFLSEYCYHHQPPP